MPLTNAAGQLRDRPFGLIFAGFFGIISGVGWFFFDVVLTWALTISAMFLVLALAAPWVLLPLNRLWTNFARYVGHFNNYLVLSLLFYIVVLPTGLLLRVFGQDPMHRAVDPRAKSYLVPIKRQADKDSFPDMF